jgi:hypothetical protein
MKRFRVTLLVVCLVLGWLGYSDLSLYLRNPAPHAISIDELSTNGAPREWLSIDGGYQDLLQAINMSGTMEIDAFLVPLKSTPESDQLLVWFETRDPEIIGALKTYYFKLDQEDQRNRFVEENRQLFFGRRDLQGLTASNLIADSNQTKLEKLLTEMGVPVSERIIFISEGKQPASTRGFFFFAMALLGIGKLLFDLLRNPAAAKGGK